MAINIPLIHISDLTEKTSISDDDYMLTGGSTASKVKWSTIVSLIKTKLGIGDIEKNISKIQSDISNSSRNIVLKTSGSGNDFYISIENYTTVQKTCDKFALLLYGNGNGSPICSLITVNVSGSNVQIDGTSNIISSNVYCRASGTSIQICNLPQWGYYTVIAPPGVYIDQGGIVFDN